MWYAVIIAGLLLELLMYRSARLWRWREPAALAVIITTFIATTVVVITEQTLISLVIGIVVSWRIFNLMRIIKGRMHEGYMWRETRKTGGYLIAALLVLLVIRGNASLELVPISVSWPLLVYAQVAAAAGMLLLTAGNIRRTRHKTNTNHYSDKELPTVTVAIPARNETLDLERCLKSVLANDYPKLEVLVLDDCSQDKTADIIKSFAHDGVRFISGDEPDERWLAKNKAYDKLLDHSNGDLVLFCGVDVRFGPHAIRSLVTTLLNRNKTMISVMPRRFYGSWRTAFIQPIRYWWELVPPRRFFNRPPVLSTCWLADRAAMKSLGGFAAVSRTLLPEGYFAREFVKKDGYSFIRADQELDVQTVKRASDQHDTAIRMRYPQVKKRPELVLLLITIELLFLLGPFASLVLSVVAGNAVLATMSLLACTLLIIVHVLILQVSNPGNAATGIISFPVAVLVELWLGLSSMYRYEFSRVEWKDRNICIPVMHVTPHLPKH